MYRELKIKKSELKSLYIKCKKSTREISTIFNCIKWTIVKRIKKFNIKPRSYK